MNVTSAKFANETGDTVEIQTESFGAVLVSLPPRGDNVAGGQSAFAAWVAAGNTPSPYAPPAADTIALAEAHIETHFSTARLLQCKVWLDALPRAATPKLNSLFGWTAGVTGSAVGGGTAFPEPPVTFTEVAQECVPLLA